MNWRAAAAMGAFLAAIVLWLQREEARGTFDAIERTFVAWLSANAGERAALPPLALVLYDDEASELAGAERMGMLDAALFTRAASLLGASAAAVEGLEGDPRRMLEAADGLPVIGGYAPDGAPALGWTPLRGGGGERWTAVGGLVGSPGVFARGFLAAPLGSAGPRELPVMGRNADRPVPSLLVLAWGAAQGWRSRDLTAAEGGVFGPRGSIRVGARGEARFFPSGPARKMTMSDLLVAAEKCERAGGANSPVRGHLLVLVRATADVARIAREGGAPVTPSELWAQSWDALRRGRLFVPAGWWFAPGLWAVSAALALAAARRSSWQALTAWAMAVLAYLLAALGAYAGARVFLPLAPAVAVFALAAVAGRVAWRAGWLGR